MILDTFTLSGKVAIVTGCDTGLGTRHGHRAGTGGLRYRGRQP